MRYSKVHEAAQQARRHKGLAHGLAKLPALQSVANASALLERTLAGTLVLHMTHGMRHWVPGGSAAFSCLRQRTLRPLFPARKAQYVQLLTQ